MGVMKLLNRLLIVYILFSLTTYSTHTYVVVKLTNVVCKNFVNFEAHIFLVLNNFCLVFFRCYISQELSYNSQDNTQEAVSCLCPCLSCPLS